MPLAQDAREAIGIDRGRQTGDDHWRVWRRVADHAAGVAAGVDVLRYVIGGEPP